MKELKLEILLHESELPKELRVRLSLFRCQSMIGSINGRLSEVKYWVDRLECQLGTNRGEFNLGTRLFRGNMNMTD